METQRERSRSTHEHHEAVMSVIKIVKTGSFHVSSTDGYVFIMCLVKTLWGSDSQSRASEANAIKQEVITFAILQKHSSFSKN